ncbi:uncharacterized protein LOC111702797 [Eurytemora carolleeae]|uniref:uncharacterized protein LOC111702797 n=1 Tax=Eurytemora carolleeae TaxID=1294199 RepID=UPI000C76867D|nr:uncharacterized protein LOC111702797 [Eurytemora carolleeae]|eukprot:XP_023330341.1 uncharacterized protein LOC111702797 [Eurytemora affinis]
MGEKMGFDRPMSIKLNSAEELFQLFMNKDKLKDYMYMDLSGGMPSNEDFCLDIPYEEIKEVVEKERDNYLDKLDEPEKSQVKWEHVGSTSIKGMPGMLMPDALLIIPEFPPTKKMIQGFLDNGYYFGRTSLLDSQDLWFFRRFQDGFLKDKMISVHVVPVDNPAGKILLEMRDTCRTEQWAFDDYKNAKISANKSSSDFLGYKMGKGKNSKLLDMLRAKHQGGF